MSTYIPTKESANACVRLVARLDDPKEFARISGQTHIGAIRVQDLPSRATIRKYTVSVAKPLPGSLKERGRYTPTGTRPNNQQLTDEEKERIIGLVALGKTCLEIAKEIDVHSETIYSYAARSGISIGRHRKPTTNMVTQKMHDAIVLMAKQGMHSCQIAYHCSLTRQYIADYCKHRRIVLAKQSMGHVICKKTGIMLHKGTLQPIAKQAA